MDRIRELLILKEKKVTSKEDKEKVDILKEILKQDDAFFNLTFSAAIGILKFLEIPEEKLKETYLNLISLSSYLQNAKEYIIMEEEKTRG